MRTFIVIFLAAALAACGEENTTGRRVTVATRIQSDVPAGGTIVTNFGWTVTLRRALVSTGAFYYFDGPPAFVQAPRSHTFWASLATVFQEGTAHAHPGHYVAGNARGQMLMPWSADLLAGVADLPGGEGVTGEWKSATFSIAPPSAGPATTALGGFAALAEGTATRGEQTIHFRLTASLADVALTARDGQVTGCPLGPASVTGNGTVTVTVRPRFWLNLVDFSDLPQGSPEDPSPAPPESKAAIGFAQGLGQFSAYQFTFTPTP